MKLINKLQEGGAMPFMVYTPNPASTQAQQQSQSGAESKKDSAGMSKDIMKMIADNGIPSDVDVFMKQLSNFTGNMMDPNTSMDSLMQTPEGYNMVVSQLNKLQFNKDALIEARKELYSKGGLEEAAITTNGGVLVKNKDGEMNSISINEYAANKDDYSLVTNNELLQLRSYDKNMAFNNSVTSILSNGEGTQNITKQLQAVIGQMKTSKNSREGFMPADQLEALKGIDELTGVVKVKQDTESSRLHKDHAIEYLYNTLSQSAKNLLKVKAAQKGWDPDKGAKMLIETLIVPSTHESKSVSYDLKADGLGAGSKKSGASEKITPPDFRTAVMNDAFTKTPTQLNLGGEASIFTDAYVFNKPYDMDGKTVEQGTSVKDVINKSFGGIVDSNTVFLGDMKIPEGMLDRIAYTGEKGAVVNLPYKMVNGSAVPDFDSIKRMEEAEKEIRRDKITDPNAKKGVYDRFGVLDIIQANPNDTRIFQRFAQLPVYAYENGVISNTNSPFLRKLSGEEETAADRLVKKAYTGKPDGSLDFKTWWIDDMYKSMVYMSLSGGLMDAAIGGNVVNVPKLDYQESVERQADLQRKANAVTGKAAYQ